MKKITITIMTICLMSFSLAFYPGESITFPNEMGIEDLVYTIVGNSSPLSPFDIEINSTNITITFPQDMVPDSFDIIFIEEQTREVIKVIRRGGGSSRIEYVDNNVTVYVPEYINTTEVIETTIEVENVVEKTTILENGYEWWHMMLAIIVGIGFGWFMFKEPKEKKE